MILIVQVLTVVTAQLKSYRHENDSYPYEPRRGPPRGPPPGGIEGVSLVSNIHNGSPGQGNVMVNGRPVCDDGWGMVDGEVVCRQLGYSGIVRITQMSYFGGGSDIFAMDDVACSGTEERLEDCPYNSQDNCGRSEAAGVICTELDGGEDNVCAPNQFRCTNGFCVRREEKCNGEYACGDKSDEEGCPRPPASTWLQNLLEAVVNNPDWRRYIPDDTDTDDDGIISERELEHKFTTYMDTLFKMIDRDGDQSVSQEEIRSPRITLDHIKQIWELAFQSYPIKYYYQLMDANMNGFIDKPDFKLLSCGYQGGHGGRGPGRRGGPCQRRHAEVSIFDIVGIYIWAADENGDRRISFEELRDKASSYLEPIFKIADQNDDGVISLDDMQITTFNLRRQEILKIFDKAFDIVDIEKKHNIDMMYDIPMNYGDYLDDNFDGQLNLKDIYSAIRHNSYILLELYILSQVSRNLDRNQDGIIHHHEMTSFVDTLYNVTDMNGDGVLTPDDAYTLLEEHGISIDDVDTMKTLSGEFISFFRREYKNVADTFLVNVDDDQNNEMSLQELIGLRDDIFSARTEPYRYNYERMPEAPRSLYDLRFDPLEILAGRLDDPLFNSQ